MLTPCLRLDIWPKAFADVFPFIFIIVIIPLVYWFEVWVVLPTIFPPLSFPIAYLSLFSLGHFLLYNVVGNFLGILVADTSIRGRIMPAMDSPDASGYCDICKTVTPFRSFHCPTCKVCILRRDHHCFFSACCIGHFNYRYFIMFLFHLFISTAITLPFNVIFLWDEFAMINFLGILRIVFPVLMVWYGIGFSVSQCYICLFSISALGLLIVGTWFYFHLRLAMKGRVVHEMKHNISTYDRSVSENLEEVFGKRWHLVWISPFISSTLTCDGVYFKRKPHEN